MSFFINFTKIHRLSSRKDRDGTVAEQPQSAVHKPCHSYHKSRNDVRIFAPHCAQGGQRRWGLSTQGFPKIVASLRGCGLGNFFRRAFRDNPSPFIASLWAQIDDVVGRLDHVQMMFDHHNGVPLINKLVQDLEQPAGVLEVQTGRRLIQNIQRLAGTPRRDSSFDSFTRCASPPLSVVADCPS